jgi:RimJ/RimL family protein N-acetyltransferase
MEKQYLTELIEGERVTLKRHSIDLAQKMYQYITDDKERLARFLPWPNNINSLEDETSFIRNCNESWDNYQGVHYGIFRNSDNEYMGNISAFSFIWSKCSCEIGYWILGKFEGKGYMSDAVKLLEKKLFATGFNRIIICFDPQNKRSGSIPRRLGYSFEGISREALKIGDTFNNLEVYSKLGSQYKLELQRKTDNIKTEEVFSNKGVICDRILRLLPDWFGIENAIKNYVKEVEKLQMFVAKKDDHIVGFITIKKHNPFSAEIHVMGVIPQYHGQGLGKSLILVAEQKLKIDATKFLQVKTLGPSRKNKEYDLTRKFYESVGFYPLEELEELWDKNNPCLIMVKKIS